MMMLYLTRQGVVALEAQESNYHSIEVADYFMKILGYKRISPTDEELNKKYKHRGQEVDTCINYLEGFNYEI